MANGAWPRERRGVRAAAVVAGAVAAALLAGVVLGEQEPRPAPSTMTQARMEEIVRDVAGSVQGQQGFIQFTFDGVTMACISDPRHDRMRIIAPVAEMASLAPEQTERILEANFHTALDARYATSRGTLYAVFVHPLSSLTERDLRAAIRQVATLARTFGTTYSSGELSFGAPNR